MKIRKTQFAVIIKSIIAVRDEGDRVGEALSGMFDGATLCFTGADILENHLIDLLEAYFDDRDDNWIRWWIYDAPVSDKVVEIGGEDVDLSTFDKLYDFLKEKKKRDK